MRRTLLALAAMTAFAGAATAQTTVTLFGDVDVQARYVKNDSQTQKQLATDGNSSSRLGFRGIEDLGGGLRAGFWLEASLQADAGGGGSNTTTTALGAAATTVTNRFWHRRSTVSLMGDFGEIRLGRDTTPSWDTFADYDPFGTVGVGNKGQIYAAPTPTGAFGGASGPGQLSDIDTRVRSDNMVSYILPSTLGGLYGKFSVAAGEGVYGKRYIGGMTGYAAGPLDVRGAYSTTRASPTTDFTTGAIAGSMIFGPAKLILEYQQTKLNSVVPYKDVFMTVAGTLTLGPGTLKGSYTHLNGDGSRDADQFAVGYVYDVSKRTALYTTYAYIKNKAGAQFVTANISGFTAPLGSKNSGFDLGLRHSF
jgi:predicted porin